MKNTKTIYAQFSFYDRSGIKKFLQSQAEKGWILRKISALGWQFEKTNPKKLEYSVVYYAKASAFDPEPTPKQLAFRDFCNHTGWILAASSAQMQIFYNENENPTPIETDASIEIDSIHASAKKGHLVSNYILAGCGFLQMILFFTRLFTSPISVLSNNANILSFFAFFAMIIMSLTEIVGYFSWYKKAKSAALIDGSFVETKGYRNYQLIILLLLFVGFVLYLGAGGGGIMTIIALGIVALVIGLTAIILVISEIMKKMRFSAKVNRNLTLFFTIFASVLFTSIITISLISNATKLAPQRIPLETYVHNGWTYSVYNDNLPLKIEDLLAVDYDEYSYELSNTGDSILLSSYEASQYPRKNAVQFPDLVYSVTKIKIPFLYDLVKNYYLENLAHNYGRPEYASENWSGAEKVDSAPWGANEVYRLRLGDEMQMRYLICYDNIIVEIDFPHDWELTNEQISTISEHLGK